MPYQNCYSKFRKSLCFGYKSKKFTKFNFFPFYVINITTFLHSFLSLFFKCVFRSCMAYFYHDFVICMHQITYLSLFCCRRRRRLKGIHSRSDTNRTGAEGLSFYYPRLLYCLDQMLAVMSLSQHRVSSSKTVRPRAPCGARCIGHAVSRPTWSAVCSEATHSQFGEGARPHLCMDEWNRPTAVRRRLSL